MKRTLYGVVVFLLYLIPTVSLASTNSDSVPSLTHSLIGYTAIAIFVIAYAAVMLEEYLKLHKSKPVLLAAGLIWALIGWVYQQYGQSELVEHAIEHNLLEYAELLLFLLVAMTYINAMDERGVFDGLQSWMLKKGFNFRMLFWVTGFLAFFISPIADNLTTALLMCTVVMKLGGDNKRFVNLSCINIVVAANAGGAFSPFGDITTLMVWQAGNVEFSQFFDLFVPSAVNYLVPALIMSVFLPKEKPASVKMATEVKRGGLIIVGLFVFTIITSVVFHSLFDFPPVIGMMLGLAYLQFYGFYLRTTFDRAVEKRKAKAELEHDEEMLQKMGSIVPFDVFQRIARAEWDTLLFFYGVVMCVGGLSLLGYLSMASEIMYTQWNPIVANITIGVLSSIVDNIPVMYAVLTMEPIMSHGNWLLVTLTAGVGGSLLSIGSAAGVALMGATKGQYTFGSHLKWTPVILCGYAASILAHLFINSSLF
ncbi:sodium:proton antiporter NhaD [Vibrio tritonius]|uniref:Sodium:proton antiporter NhaD n=1 Tax=Vibrio tritonius TaxID=1435069 RepID=A0ABS7YMT2_9VIBR|nr:sodium:proton antiporter NhaD [Vibrio tritonius]MCA2016176.1 sodium:proton antiporter NhaD [Vibrio tritonius]